MKVLLVGEYSGFHNNLKDGLMQLGHQVTLASGGDGYKKLPADILWESKYSGFAEKIERLGKIVFSLPKLNGFDLIQIINPAVFSLRHNYNQMFLKYLLNNNGKSYYVAAGDDPVVWEYWKQPWQNKMKYSWVQDVIKYDLDGLSSPWENKKLIDWQQYLTKKVDGIIPIMFEYAQAYRNFANLRHTIPIPINTDKILFRENVVKNKLVVFHGLNRYGSKGTFHVEEAFKILQTKYPNDLELIIDGRMSYEKYLNIIEKANVIVDQVSSHSLAINALISMAKGKVVLGGSEPEGINELEYKDCPAINVKPNPSDIVRNIEYLLENRNKVQEIGQRSRLFVEENHHYIKIASKYIATWNE